MAGLRASLAEAGAGVLLPWPASPPSPRVPCTPASLLLSLGRCSCGGPPLPLVWGLGAAGGGP